MGNFREKKLIYFVYFYSRSKAIKINPYYSKAYFWRGNVKQNLDLFEDAIKDRVQKKFSSETTFIGINSAEIKEHQQNKNMLEVTIEFVSEIISCVKDKDNKIVSGDPEKIKKVLDTWKFSKDSRSTNPNWLLIDTQA